MESFRQIPLGELPPDAHAKLPAGCIAVFRSENYLAMLFEPLDGAQRISVVKGDYDRRTMRAQDGMTWDELQGVKRMIGFGDCFAVEIYPEESRVVNDANMRHLWLLPERLPFAW